MLNLAKSETEKKITEICQKDDLEGFDGLILFLAFQPDYRSQTQFEIELMPGRDEHVGKNATDNRQFLSPVRWITRTGAPWHDLPSRYGDRNRAKTYKEFYPESESL